MGAFGSFREHRRTAVMPAKAGFTLVEQRVIHWFEKQSRRMTGHDACGKVASACVGMASLRGR